MEVLDMNLFDRKAKRRIVELEIAIREANATIEKLVRDENNVYASRDALIKTLRDQDQLIYFMSQCTDWPSMRKHFNKLQEGTDRRMRLESDRIRDVLIPEVRKAYTETTKQPRINYDPEADSPQGNAIKQVLDR